MFKPIGAAFAAAFVWLIAGSALAQTQLSATAGTSVSYSLTSSFNDTAVVSAGALPPGVSIGFGSIGLNLALVGAPEAEGIFDFSIDTRSCPAFVCGATTTTAYRMTVGPMPQTTLADIMVDVPYTSELASGQRTASLASGTLPPGLVISPAPPPSTGSVLSGTPTTPGDYTYQIRTQNTLCFPTCSFETTEYSLTVVAGPTPVPTMTEWAMILFGVILAGGAALHIQRGRFAT